MNIDDYITIEEKDHFQFDKRTKELLEIKEIIDEIGFLQSKILPDVRVMTELFSYPTLSLPQDKK